MIRLIRPDRIRRQLANMETCQIPEKFGVLLEFIIRRMNGEIKPCGLEPGPLMQCYFTFDTLFVENRPEKRNALV